VVNYPVTVAVKNPPPGVKTGMTSNVNIVTDQKNDVLMVANRAIRNVGRQKMATVLFEGRQIQAPVVTGMSGDSQTEIVSGLNEGDVVVVGTTTTTQNSGFGGPGGGGGFGPGGPGR